MVKLIPIAGGKGGVGKSLLSVNLAVALAQAGQTVVLVDLDLGGTNLHTFLGLKNNKQGIGSLITKENSHIDQLIMPTEVSKLYFIPGDTLVPGSANIAYMLKAKIIRELYKVVADYVIIDLGAGSSYNVIDFFLTVNTGIIITSPQITSILNAYSFLKSSVFRLLIRSFKPKSDERELLKKLVAPNYGEHKDILGLVLSELKKVSIDAYQLANEKLAGFVPKIVINMGKDKSDILPVQKLGEIAQEHLGIKVEYLGFLPFDKNMDRSVVMRKPLALINPESLFMQGLKPVVKALLAAYGSENPSLFSGDESLEQLYHGMV